MRKFEDLSLEERHECLKAARSFAQNHTAYVNQRINDTHGLGVAPSGGDCFHPDLWKGIHWKWFRELTAIK